MESDILLECKFVAFKPLFPFSTRLYAFMISCASIGHPFCFSYILLILPTILLVLVKKLWIIVPCFVLVVSFVLVSFCCSGIASLVKTKQIMSQFLPFLYRDINIDLSSHFSRSKLIYRNVTFWTKKQVKDPHLKRHASFKLFSPLFFREFGPPSYERNWGEYRTRHQNGIR